MKVSNYSRQVRFFVNFLKKGTQRNTFVFTRQTRGASSRTVNLQPELEKEIKTIKALTYFMHVEHLQLRADCDIRMLKLAKLQKQSSLSSSITV